MFLLHEKNSKVPQKLTIIVIYILLNYFAVFVFSAPGVQTGNYNPFVMERIFHEAQDEVTCLEWSFDSNLLAVGSKDTSTRLYSLQKWRNFKHYSFGSHSDVIVGCFFEKNSYDISTISRYFINSHILLFLFFFLYIC